MDHEKRGDCGRYCGMNIKSFKKSGHFPSLLSAFLYFDVSFMIWVMVSAVALYITKDFGLTDAQKATMVALPSLGGAILRIPMGILADRIGCKKTGIIGMIITLFHCFGVGSAG